MKDITTEEAVQELKNVVQMFKDIKVTANRTGFKTFSMNLCYAIEKVLNELKKKDKIIDAMAELIEECRQNNCLESEDIDLSQIAGVKAIKQYFEMEVKDE